MEVDRRLIVENNKRAFQEDYIAGKFKENNGWWVLYINDKLVYIDQDQNKVLDKVFEAKVRACYLGQIGSET